MLTMGQEFDIADADGASLVSSGRAVPVAATPTEPDTDSGATRLGRKSWATAERED